MFVTSEAGDVEVRVFLPILTWNFLLFFWLRVHGVTSRAHAKHALFYQKQRRVVHVLEGILSTSDPAQ